MNQADMIFGGVSPLRSETKLEDLELSGCGLNPISNYLKALGILKIVPEAKGYWQRGKFHVVVPYSWDKLRDGVLNGYVASPICTPWNGSCGLYKKMPLRLSSILESQSERWRFLKYAYQQSQKVIKRKGLKSQPKGKDKVAFVREIRAIADDDNKWLLWLDTVAIKKIIIDKQGSSQVTLTYPGITGGTGGSVGNKDLGAVYLEAIEHIYDLSSGNPLPQANLFLKSSLLGISVENSLIRGSILTQFSPISDYYRDISGAKAHSEYAESGGGSTSMCNPFDVILLIEGLLSLSGVSAKKLDQKENFTQAEFSLAVDLAGGTADITTITDENSRRLEEIWLPVWSEPLSWQNLRNILADMRNRLPNQQMSDSIDFAHKMSRLGKGEGFLNFNRYSFLPRKGQGNFAIYIGSVNLTSDNLLADDLAAELRTFRRSCYVLARGNYSTTNIRSAVRQLDRELFELATGRGSYTNCLILLGKLAIAISRSSIVGSNEFVPTPPRLSFRWINTILEREQSLECRLAVSLASLSLRRRASKIVLRKNRFYWDKEQTPTWGKNNLCQDLIDLQRQWQVERSQGVEPFGSKLVSPSFQDLIDFVNGNVDEQKIEQIAIGVSLCQQVKKDLDNQRQAAFLPPHYSLSALCQWSRDFQAKPTLEATQIVNQLARNESQRAMSMAVRKLQGQRLSPLLVDSFSHPRSKRIAAALAFPLSIKQLNSLSKYHLK